MSCNFCEEQLPYNTNYGAIWLDKTDRIGQLKWTSKQCSPFAECSAKNINIVNTIKIKYCPMCGKKIIGFREKTRAGALDEFKRTLINEFCMACNQIACDGAAAGSIQECETITMLRDAIESTAEQLMEEQ